MLNFSIVMSEYGQAWFTFNIKHLLNYLQKCLYTVQHKCSFLIKYIF